jgi:hypothetical protein
VRPTGLCRKLASQNDSDTDGLIPYPYLELKAMNPAIPPAAEHGDWKSLYRAAILETNRHVIQQRVSEAEKAGILIRLGTEMQVKIRD